MPLHKNRLRERGVNQAEIIAQAASIEGKYSQAFPKFGPERTGAPVEAYCRIDDRFIDLRTQVYSPNHIIVLDDSLLSIADATNGLDKKGYVIINSAKSQKINGFKTYNVDATKIALEVLGMPIVNTAMLGAFAKATGIVKLKSIEKAIGEKFTADLTDRNIKAVRKAYDETKH